MSYNILKIIKGKIYKEKIVENWKIYKKLVNLIKLFFQLNKKQYDAKNKQKSYKKTYFEKV